MISQENRPAGVDGKRSSWCPSQLLAWPLKCVRLAAMVTTKCGNVEGHIGCRDDMVTPYLRFEISSNIAAR